MEILPVKPLSVLRVRASHPLIDEDGSCPLLYDLERTLVLEVPPEFQQRLAPALESGNFDPGLREWLTSEDVVTAEEKISWAQGAPSELPMVSDVSFDMSGSCNMGCSYCFENDIFSRIGKMSDQTAMATLD